MASTTCCNPLYRAGAVGSLVWLMAGCGTDSNASRSTESSTTVSPSSTIGAVASSSAAQSTNSTLTSGTQSTAGNGSTTQAQSSTSAAQSSGTTQAATTVASSSTNVTSQDNPSNDETAPSDGCMVGGWPTADPAAPGPFETTTETNVGPAVGQGEEDGGLVAFTVFRPADLAASGRCHPVITWGNGTGSNPGLYKSLLNHFASHGFIVVASDSPNVAQGDPPPMVAGVEWLLEQNDDAASPYYHHVDVAHVGATGHSQGGFATTAAGGNEHITTIAPLCGASSQRNLHGPALLLCGGADEVVPCDTIANALNSITQPAMLAEYITADHADWITFRGTTLSPMEIATTAWMRVHLMDDLELRSWFYGASCKLCTDDAWSITQKMMDE